MGERVEEIRARLEATTKRPWEWDDWTHVEPEDAGWWVNGIGTEGAVACVPPYVPRGEANAIFIASAPDDIAYLLARLRRGGRRSDVRAVRGDDGRRALRPRWPAHPSGEVSCDLRRHLPERRRCPARLGGRPRRRKR